MAKYNQYKHQVEGLIQVESGRFVDPNSEEARESRIMKKSQEEIQGVQNYFNAVARDWGVGTSNHFSEQTRNAKVGANWKHTFEQD
ncbi:MAG: hypothetical protein KKF48_01835 [Nanoarchaeota archaeon]|nr:hypothetical protein [Nanoarchaeota archaeon]MBU1027761.1 hypothetical protein [Nanoarchaeota archaeon]